MRRHIKFEVHRASIGEIRFHNFLNKSTKFCALLCDHITAAVALWITYHLLVNYLWGNKRNRELVAINPRDLRNDGKSNNSSEKYLSCARIYRMLQNYSILRNSFVIYLFILLIHWRIFCYLLIFIYSAFVFLINKHIFLINSRMFWLNFYQTCCCNSHERSTKTS